MITLLTGLPGAGKTAEMVLLLSKLGQDRPLYVKGVNGLTLPHFDIDPLVWHETVPDGSVVAIDEVQEFWRPRSSGSKVPPCIAALEKHRHTGTDFYITTQHPGLLDANVRALVGRHIHIRDVGVLGRWWYEWPEIANPAQYKNAPVQRRHKLPKEVFPLYKSASVHIKPLRSFPRALVYLALLVLLMVVGIGYVYHSINAKMNPVAPAVAASAARPSYGKGTGSGMLTGAAIVASFTPRIESRADTAPAYDALRVVVNMPRVVGGFCQGRKCRCMTQQNTDAGLTNDQCRTWLKSPPFDPYYAQAPVGEAKPGASHPPGEAPAPAPSLLPTLDVVASR